MTPISILNQWLAEESAAGAPNPAQAVLATCSKGLNPHSRVIAIREISSEGLLFFTQIGTRKVEELQANPAVSLNFWFELMQRQVIIEGNATRLDEGENNAYWTNYPRFAQLRFYAYAPTSSQEISNKDHLEHRKMAFEKQFVGQDIPTHPLYCGYRIKPRSFLFYAYRTDELSDVVSYFKQEDGTWQCKLVSP